MKAKIAIAALLVVVFVVVAVSLLGGDDGDDDRAGDGSGTSAEQSGGGGNDDDDAPQLKTLATERAEGKNAVVAVSDLTARPREFWLRVSAAPKQVVKGSWNVSCSGGGNELDTFEVTPPQLMKLRVPTKNARSCTAGAQAQLTGEGRLKLAILRDG